MDSLDFLGFMQYRKTINEYLLHYKTERKNSIKVIKKIILNQGQKHVKIASR